MTDHNGFFSWSQTLRLEDNLDPHRIKTRRQGRDQFSYIEGWDSITTANSIFGFGEWERQTIRLEETNRELLESYNNQGEQTRQWRVGFLCVARIIVHSAAGSRQRDGVGFGSGFAREHDLGGAIESAIKEAETDATKRALATFGNQFGLALYDKKRAAVGPSKLAHLHAEAEPDVDAEDPSAASEIDPLLSAIRSCKTIALLKAWGADNTQNISRQSPANVQRVRSAYLARMEQLRQAHDPGHVNGHAGPEQVIQL
jgi:DNA recombination protein Rad52